MRPEITTNIANKKVKFFIFDSSTSLLFVAVLIFQNLISLLLFLFVNIFFTMIINRGFSLGMTLRKFSVMLTGKKKYRYYPPKKKDHLFD